MSARPGDAAVALLADPTSPLSDVLGALTRTLHRVLNLPPQASSIADDIDQLHYFEATTMWAVGAAIVAAGAFFVLRYRRRGPADDTRATPKVTAPAWLELGFAALLLALFCGYWVVGFQQWVHAMTPPREATEVYVTARQWVWKFAYADGPTTAGTLIVPEDRPVRLVVTSRDVIHSFFVPAFRIKRDAVPGRYTTVWFEPTRAGRYDVLCAELCGAGHTRMWAEVIVLPPERYDAWLAGHQPEPTRDADEPRVLMPDPAEPAEELLLRERGLRVAAEHGCLRCHTTDGTPHLGPTWKDLYLSLVPLQNGDTVVADPAYLTESMMDPEAKIVAGFGPMMPTFQGQLTPGEVAALIEYIRALSGAGDAPRRQAPAGGRP